MRTEGVFAPATRAQAREQYERVGPTAQVVVREAARAMGFDRTEYDERVTGEVIETVRDALFASLLTVHVGDREEFEGWRAEHPDYEVVEYGSPDVPRVVWHPIPFAEEVVAATFADEERAAVGTLRRQAFGRVYEDELSDAGREDPAGGDGGNVADEDR